MATLERRRPGAGEPADRPQQTYSWYVDASLTVCSFANVLPDGSFGGVPAPLLYLELDGEYAGLSALAAELDVVRAMATSKS